MNYQEARAFLDEVGKTEIYSYFRNKWKGLRAGISFRNFDKKWIPHRKIHFSDAVFLS